MSAYVFMMAGVVLVSLRRTMVLYDFGLNLAEVRIREVFSSELYIPYESIVEGDLLRKHGEWIFKARTRDKRRILIVGSHFREPNAVLEFLMARLPEVLARTERKSR